MRQSTDQAHILIINKWFKTCLLALGFDHPFTAIIAAGADVVTQMRFAGGGFNRQCRRSQKIVGAMHTTLRRGFFVLLDSHNLLLKHYSALNKYYLFFISASTANGFFTA